MEQPQPRRSHGTIFHHRKQLEWAADTFRILSIDGGGIKGILPAAVLAECERRFLKGGSAAAYFDLLAGTSTGGIIALGLSAGMRAAEVLDIYLTPRREDISKRVVPRHSLWDGRQNPFTDLRATWPSTVMTESPWNAPLGTVSATELLGLWNGG